MKDSAIVLWANIALIFGLIINTLLSFYLKKRLSKVEKWQAKRDSKNILIILLDDNEDDLELMEYEVLSKIENKWLTYTDSVVLLNEMPDEPSVYVIDGLLPKLSGLEMARLIKERNRKNFIILNTGSVSDHDTITDYTEQNVERYVHKNSSKWVDSLIKAINDGIEFVSIR